MATMPMQPQQAPQSLINQEADTQGSSNPKPIPGRSDEATQDDPSKKAPQNSPDQVDEQPPAKDTIEFTEDEQKEILRLIGQYTEDWAPVRRPKIRLIQRACEYFRNRQYITYDYDLNTYYDPMDALFTQDLDKEDLTSFRYVNNVYQMLALSFVAALSPQIPKTRYTPNNAERVADVATAKACSQLAAIIEDQNKAGRLLKKQLMKLWLTGGYYRYTRFLVDGRRNKTTRVPVHQEVEQEILPERFNCAECGAITPTKMLGKGAYKNPTCVGSPIEKGCGAPLDPSNYYPAETAMVAEVVGYKDVPNGRVCQDIYSSLNIITAPYANELYETPMLRFDLEVDVGALRMCYPKFWEQIQPMNTASDITENERQARQTILSLVGGRNNMAGLNMPTLSRTWLQPEAFGRIEKKDVAMALMKKCPDGCMIVHIGDLFLEGRKQAMKKYWTWCSAIEDQGQLCPGVGDVALDPQDQINDNSNTIQDYMDRTANGLVLVDGSEVDTRKMNRKPLLSGVLNEVPRKGISKKPLRDIIAEITFSQNSRIDERLERLIMFAQLVSGVQPQIFGGSDKNVKTAEGQAQQLRTAIGRLSLFYDNVRDESSEASGLAIRCAAENYTDDILNVVGGGTTEFRNEYVRINDLSGEFHASAETDAGYPQTSAEIQQRLLEMFSQGKDNELFMEVMGVYSNQELFAIYCLPPGVKLPNEDHRVKCLRIINLLLQGKAKVVPLPPPGAPPGTPPIPTMIPSIPIDLRYDKPGLIADIVTEWATENFDMAEEKPDGWANIQAYFDMASAIEATRQAQQQITQAMALSGATGGPMPGTPAHAGAQPNAGANHTPKPPAAPPNVPKPTPSTP